MTTSLPRHYKYKLSSNSIVVLRLRKFCFLITVIHTKRDDSSVPTDHVEEIN